MTAPVTTAAPGPRAAPAGASPGGSGDSAEPFASALDGALSGGQNPVRGHGGRQTSGDAAPGEDGAATGEAAADGVTVVDTAAAGVAAALWALALGSAAGSTAGSTAAGPTTGTVGASSATLAAGIGAGAAAAATEPGAAIVPGPVPPAGTPAPAAPPMAPTTPAVHAAAAPVAAASGAPGGAATAQSAAPLSVVVSASGGPAAAATATGAVTGVPGEAPEGPGAPPPTALPPAGAVGDGAATADDGGPGGEPRAAVAASLPDAGAGTAGHDSPVVPGTTGSVSAPGQVTAAAPVAASGAATGSGATLPVSGQVARQVAVLSGAGDGSHTMTLVLTPENLGPVEVKVTVGQGGLDLTLRGAHELGRAALLDALPELRRDLESAGLSPSRVEVDADAGGSWLARHAAEQQAQQGPGGRSPASDGTGERFRSGQRTADSGEEGPPRPRMRSTSSGVDVLA